MLTTIKLNKTASEKNTQKRKKPVRRVDASQRDRSLATKQVRDAEQKLEKSATKVDQPASKQAAKSQSAPKAKQSNQPKSRDEGHYRQAPKRHGKARDGYDASKPKKVDPVAVGDKLPRLSKVMAQRGLCSRREADMWIENGWVKVDGEIVDTLGTRIAEDADIVVSGYAQEAQDEQVTILLHKPVGFVSGQAEDGYKPAITLVHPDQHWDEDITQKTFQRRFLQGLAPAGRLDIDSTGLLVLTQDGRVARHLIGNDTKVEKEYLVRVEGELSHEGLTKLNYGLSLDGVKLKRAKVSWQNEDQLRFVLREGKKRQIRRMCELVGLHVVGLKRIRIGSITLGKLPVGEWRYLHHNEKF